LNHRIALFIGEIKAYELSTWISTDEALLKKHGPHLFFKHHENEYPVYPRYPKLFFH